MKRILLSVFAAAVTAAWAVPASAADVTFSGQYRVRGEYRYNADFQKNNADDNSSSIGQRVRLTANAKATDDTSVKLTLQDTRTWGSAQATAGGPSLTDDGTSNVTDLHEAYLNINNLFDTGVAFRAGRQELVYGDERLIGAFGWSNNGRSFDAFKLVYSSDVANVDLFASKIKEATTSTTSGQDNDQDFYGAYATVKSIPNNTLDVYALYLRDGSTTAMIANNTTITGVNETQTLWTIGARLKGAVAGLDYTLEVPFQTGKINTSGTDYDVNAYAAAVKLGYTLPTPMKIRVGAEYDYATGDDNSTDDKIETFSNLFPTNHDKLGFMDQQAWRNVQAFNLNAKIDVNEKLGVLVSWWNFTLAEKNDSWYSAATWNNAASGTLRSAGSRADSTEDGVGNEIDLVATYKYNNATTLELGYSRFMAGDYIKKNVTTDREDQDWAYLQITANF